MVKCLQCRHRVSPTEECGECQKCGPLQCIGMDINLIILSVLQTIIIKIN